MLSSSEWWAVIIDYNKRIFPAQWVLYLILAVLAIYLMVGRKEATNTALKLVLGVVNIWIGIGFFMLNSGFPVVLRTVQGILFITIGLLLLSDIRKKLFEFGPVKGSWQYRLYIIGMFVMLLYPLVALFQGKSIDHCIVQGTLPCPTTAYTLLLIITAKRRHVGWLYTLLLIWAIPFAPLIQIPKYGVYEDGIMFVTGIIGLVLYVQEIIKNISVAKSV